MTVPKHISRRSGKASEAMWAQFDGPWARPGPASLLMLGCRSAFNTRLPSLLSFPQARKSSGCHRHPQDLSHLRQPEEETLEALDWHTGFLCAKGNTEITPKVLECIHSVGTQYLVPSWFCPVILS